MKTNNPVKTITLKCGKCGTDNHLTAIEIDKGIIKVSGNGHCFYCKYKFGTMNLLELINE